MKRKDRAELIKARLNTLYPNPLIPLDHKDTFTLLVAVLLSAQCTDKKVNEITPSLFKAAACPKSMRSLGKEKIMSLIKSIGLSRKKAKHLYELSGIICNDFKGEVPKDLSSLESLPGVGHKTASVVMAQAFGKPAFPVDTHIHRLSQRWGLSKGKNVLQTERDLKHIFPKSNWNTLHLQMIYYGREHCTARGCDGTVCELCKELFPNRKTPVTINKA